MVSLTDDQVTFRYRDRVNGNQMRTINLRGLEFLRRFLLHVLPKGFVRIRHFSLLANRVRKANLARCRSLLGASTTTERRSDTSTANPDEDPGLVCPTCRSGRLRCIAILSPGALDQTDPDWVPALDTS